MPKERTLATVLKKLRARIAKAPQKPGVYRWLDAAGNILYIGKAKHLRNRLKTYLAKVGLPRTQAARPVSERSEWYRERMVRGPWKLALLKAIADVDWTLTQNELEALILETNLIKEHRPKFNVLMKDDKNYVYVKITTEEAYPRVDIVRRIDDDHATYFGPFVSGYDLRDTLDLLHTVFAWRACKRSLDVLNRASIRPAPRVIPSSTSPELAEGRSAYRGTRGWATQHDTQLKECLEYQIGKCNGLCVGKVTQEEYRRRMEQVIRFFRGDHSEVIARLRAMMQEAAVAKQFEKAAKFRNTLAHIQSLEEQQIVSGTSGANTDVFGIALLRGRAQVVLLQERDGKVVHELSFTLQGNAENAGDVLSQFLPQYYLNTQDIPDTVIVPPFETPSPRVTLRRSPKGDVSKCAGWAPQDDTLKDDIPLIAEWLSKHKGRRVAVVVPARGKKSKLLQMAEENAHEKVEQQLASWEAETLKVEHALRDLKEALRLPEIPKRIECYDISHLGGTETVGSMVVAIDGKPRNDHYRSFTIRTMKRGEIDDYKALREVLTRRLRHLTNTEEQWKERGVAFGKARKQEQGMLETITERHPNDLSAKGIDYRDFVVAREEEHIVAFGRMVKHEDEVQEIKSVWVDEEHRGQKLGHAIVQKLFARLKKGKVYVTIAPDLEEYYAQLSFRYVQKAPKSLEKSLRREKRKNPSCSCGTVMMLDLSKHKPDPSLTSTPDLLILDGGKGQLGVGVEVLKRMNLEIPVISLAKEHEEVFVPAQKQPLPLGEEARFLLMRLRDEAHRFANRHRERRAKHALVS